MTKRDNDPAYETHTSSPDICFAPEPPFVTCDGTVLPTDPVDVCRPIGEPVRINLEDFRQDLIASITREAEVFHQNDAIITEYCRERGITKAAITIDQMMEVREHPEWKTA